jgi:polyhydroxybutyrate depolymerase
VPGISTVTHVVSGATFRAEVYRPASMHRRRPAVVIDLHGLYSDGPTQAALSRFRQFADAPSGGFLVVSPTGQPGPLGGTGWEIDALDEPGRDDDRYLTELIDTVVSRHCADPRRVYLAGYSNGGLFAAEYACRHPGRIAAIATVAGFLHADDCADPTPVVAFHGTADPIVPFAAGGDSILVAEDTPVAVVELLGRGAGPQVAASAAAAGCSPEPKRTALAADVVRVRWRGCDDARHHELYEIDGGGHTWPGAEEQPDGDFVGRTTASIDATEIAWAFFQRHRATLA